MGDTIKSGWLARKREAVKSRGWAMLAPVPRGVKGPVLKPGAPVTDEEAREAVAQCLGDGSAAYPAPGEAKVPAGKSALPPMGRLA